MSGHSKWHSIKHKKGAEDARRGKIFTKHAKLVAVAARKGGDQNMNPSLRAAIDNARAENMPYDNIERAIKKGTGEGKDGIQYSEVIYEARGPASVIFYIECLTENKNRSVSDLKNIITKNGGTMLSAGAIAFLFNKKGLITAPLKFEEEEDKRSKTPPKKQKSVEEIELAAIDAGAEEVQPYEEEVEIYTDPTSLMQVKENLLKSGVIVGKAVLTYVPTQEVQITDSGTAQKVLDFIEAIEDNDDVNTVYSNANISPEALS